MHIESGPTGERRVRTLLLFLMVAGFSGWFAYDGWKGYPRRNFEEHLTQIPAEKRDDARAAARVYPTVTDRLLPQAQEIVRKSLSQAARRSGLEALFGGPPSWESPEVWYYFGPAYRIAVSFKGGGGPVVTGHPTAKGATDILLQKALAIGLAVVSIGVLVLLVGVFTTRAVLDDSGLTYRRKGVVRWEDMQALDSERFAAKGWVDLVYVKEGEQRRLRLDEYHLAKFDEIIDALCAKKGFINPLPLVRKPASDGSPSAKS